MIKQRKHDKTTKIVKTGSCMSTDWIENELKNVNLNDQRLNARLADVLAALSERPNLSIPAACGGHTETVAAYRFFDNEKSTFDKIIRPHYQATERRIAQHEVVLCVQDTTEIDLTKPQQDVQGAGPLGEGDHRRGAFLHLLEAFLPSGVPLGAVWSKILIREDKEPQETLTPQEKKRQQNLRYMQPITEKESIRWLEGFREVNQWAGRNPDVCFVCTGDSESDIFELFAEPHVPNAHLLVRACQDRCVAGGDAEHASIRSVVSAGPVLGTSSVFVRARQPAVACTKKNRQLVRKSRHADLEIRATTLTIRPPKHLRGKYEAVTLNVVLVSEPKPPQGEEAIEWILLSTLPIATFEQVLLIIEYYASRWMIEIFFKTLKSGCGIEKLRFEKMERLLPCLAVYLIVAWRVLMLCRLGRDTTETSCEIVFDASEWKSTYRVMHPKKKLPSTPPTLHAMMRLVGELGGWVASPNREDMPGPQTVWIGLQRVRDFAWAWKTFGPDSQKYKKDV